MGRHALLCVLSACGFHAGGAARDAAPADGAPPGDVPYDRDGIPLACLERWQAGTVRFGTPVAIAEINSALVDRDPFVAADELSIYFSSYRASATADIYVATRAATTEPFSTPVLFAPATTAGNDTKISMTDDQLLLTVSTDRAGGQGDIDVWGAERASTASNFGALDEAIYKHVNDKLAQFDGQLSADGLHLYLAPYNPPQQIVLATRTSRSMDFSAPQSLPEISDPAGDGDPSPSHDERIIVFSSNRSGSAQLTNLWYATRATGTAPFGTPAPIPDVNGDSFEGDPVLSRDGCRLYFSSTRDSPGDWNIFVATQL